MRKNVRRCAGLLAMILLLGGCGSSGGAGQAGSPETSQAAETVTESTSVESTTAEKTTEAVTSAEEMPETSASEEETTEAVTTAETTEAAASEEETPEAVTTAEGTTAAETAGTAAAEETAGAQQESAPAAEAPAENAVSLSDIYSQIEQQVSLNSPMTVPEEFIASYFGIDVSTAEDYLFVMSEMATSAETIVILKPAAAGKQAAIDSLQMVLDQKAAEMENYLPDQYDIVSRSSVQQTGDYVWLVISENAGAIRSIIEAGLQ